MLNLLRIMSITNALLNVKMRLLRRIVTQMENTVEWSKRTPRSLELFTSKKILDKCASSTLLQMEVNGGNIKKISRNQLHVLLDSLRSALIN